MSTVPPGHYPFVRVVSHIITDENGRTVSQIRCGQPPAGTTRPCARPAGHSGEHQCRLVLCWELVDDAQCARKFGHEGEHGEWVL